MADNNGVYEITANLQASPSSSVEYSAKILGNLNLRRTKERTKEGTSCAQEPPQGH